MFLRFAIIVHRANISIGGNVLQLAEGGAFGAQNCQAATNLHEILITHKRDKNPVHHTMPLRAQDTIYLRI